MVDGDRSIHCPQGRVSQNDVVDCGARTRVHDDELYSYGADLLRVVSNGNYEDNLSYGRRTVAREVCQRTRGCHKVLVEAHAFVTIYKHYVHRASYVNEYAVYPSSGYFC